MLLAHLNPTWFLSTIHRGDPIVLGHFLLFSPLLRYHLTLLQFLLLSFFFKLRLGCRPTVVVRGGGRVRGSWASGASLDADPLFLSTIRSLKPFLGFRAIKSSSLELLSTSTIINWRERATEDLLNSPSESGISTRSAHTFSSSLSRN